ncbi:MAG: Trm112 family protein [Enterobacterales bacterium]|nr:Trm112 family protein [Enterobacterales bacterium]
MDKSLYEIIVCPSCHGNLEKAKQADKLVCRFDRLVFDIDEGIPVLLTEKAEMVTQEAMEALL